MEMYYKTDIDFISKEQLMELSETISRILKEESNINKKTQEILKILKQGASLIDSFRYAQVTKGSQNKKENYNKLLLKAAKYILKIRSFISDEDIDFIIQIQTPESGLSEVVVTQDQLLKGGLRIGKNGALQLDTAIKKSEEAVKTAQTLLNTSGWSSAWAALQEAGTVSYNKDNSVYESTKVSSSGKVHKIYQNKKRDLLTYISFAGESKTPSFWYGDNINSISYYNLGIVYEHFNKLRASLIEAQWENPMILYGDFLSQIAFIEPNPINTLLKDHQAGENVSFIKGGDIYLNGKAYQVKGNNNVIMSCYQIISSLNEIYQCFYDILSNSQNFNKNFQDIFYDKTGKITDQANSDYSKKFNELLEIFSKYSNKTLKSTIVV